MRGRADFGSADDAYSPWQARSCPWGYRGGGIQQLRHSTATGTKPGPVDCCDATGTGCNDNLAPDNLLSPLLVPGRGLEPLYAGPKPAVLPLNDPGRNASEVIGPHQSHHGGLVSAARPIASNELWVHLSRSAASACARRSTRRCSAVHGTRASAARADFQLLLQPQLDLVYRPSAARCWRSVRVCTTIASGSAAAIEW